MLKILCNKCNKELDQPGSLAFSPPDKYHECKKFHICTSCWPLFEKWISEKVQKRDPNWHQKELEKLGYKKHNSGSIEDLLYREIANIFPGCKRGECLNRFNSDPFPIKFSAEDLPWARGDWSANKNPYAPLTTMEPHNYELVIIPRIRENILKEIESKIKQMEYYSGVSFYRNNSTEESILFIHGIYENEKYQNN